MTHRLHFLTGIHPDFFVLPFPNSITVILVLFCWDKVQEWSHARRTLSTCEKTPSKQGKNLVTSFSLKHRTVLGTCFHATPSVYQTGVVLLQLLLLMCLYGKTRLPCVKLVFMIVHLPRWLFLTLRV